jgi:hypothetical protein
VVKPKATGSESEREHIVAKVAESGSHPLPGPKSIRSDPRWILADHNTRAKQANNADEFGPEVVMLSSPDAPGIAIALAGVAPRDYVALPVGGAAGREGPNVVVAANIGPVSRKYLPAERGEFDLPRTRQAGLLETEVYPANPGEE